MTLRRLTVRDLFVGAVGAAAGVLLKTAIVPSTDLLSRLVFAGVAAALLVAAERSGFGRGIADSELRLLGPDRAITEGDVVQIDPEDALFGGCLLVVTQVATWHVEGYVRAPYVRAWQRAGATVRPLPGDVGAYVTRVRRDQVRRIGRVGWPEDPLFRAQQDAG